MRDGTGAAPVLSLARLPPTAPDGSPSAPACAMVRLGQIRPACGRAGGHGGSSSRCRSASDQSRSCLASTDAHVILRTFSDHLASHPPPAPWSGPRCRCAGKRGAFPAGAASGLRRRGVRGPGRAVARPSAPGRWHSTLSDFPSRPLRALPGNIRSRPNGGIPLDAHPVLAGHSVEASGRTIGASGGRRVPSLTGAANSASNAGLSSVSEFRVDCLSPVAGRMKAQRHRNPGTGPVVPALVDRTGPGGPGRSRSRRGRATGRCRPE